MKAELIAKHFTTHQIIEQSNFQYYIDSGDEQLVSQALQLIKADYEKFDWRVNVQADSLAAADQQIVKDEKVQFINAVATFIQSAASVLVADPSLSPIMLNTLKYAVSGFKGSQELEGIIDQTIDQQQKKLDEQANKPPQPSPEEQKAKMDMEIKQQNAQMDSAKKQEDLAYSKQKHDMDLRFKAMSDKMDLQSQNQKNMMDTIKKQTDMIMGRKEKLGRPPEQA